MRVLNINCEYIRVQSASYYKLYGLDRVKGLEIKVSVNGAEEISENIIMDEVERSWEVTVPFTSNTRIVQLYLKNVLTGQLYPLLGSSSSYTVSAASLAAIKAVAANSILTELYLSGVTQEYTLGESSFTYSFDNLPDNIVPLSFAVTESGVGKGRYFTYTGDYNFLINSGEIYLLPDFFGEGKTTFDDGIYDVTVNVLGTDDVLMREQTCFFMDCATSRGLISNIDIEECKESDIRLMMMHYSLRVASNRECDCDKMQDIFDYVNDNLDTTNTDPCEC